MVHIGCMTVLNLAWFRAPPPGKSEEMKLIMDDFEIKPILESLIFISDNPLLLDTLIEILPESNKEAILEGIEQIKREYAEGSKGFEFIEGAGGYQFRTKPRWAEWVNRLKKAKAVKLSLSALAALAMLDYHQP